jgi:hypothetical protein
MANKIEYIANACRWFDKVNGNTYHSVRITRTKDGAVLKSSPVIYGYGDAYRDTAISLMVENKWISEKYKKHNYMFERENNYPISWNVSDGLKRDMKNNVA